LQMLTAHTVAQAILQHAPQAGEVLVCGGGAYNSGLMDALRSLLNCPVIPTSERGLPVQWVEAMAFAWLAQAHIQGRPANLPT
ncbi:anhydro-N-acetylmuramic acid kinase, partial [Pseudomonas aeruginosa]|uniref:anhydro-N-acetylmuramic acid kinase n=1 Tax=Pseudomonas aeruginosa TaxID=287 RepID=UPI00396F442E